MMQWHRVVRDGDEELDVRAMVPQRNGSTG
jgi:hypothetical protein